MFKFAVLAFFISFFLCTLFIALSKKIQIFLTDHLHIGPQTFHSKPTPRIGGLAVFTGLSVALIIAYLRPEEFYSNYLFLILFSLPVFLAGFIEDLTGKLNPKIRMLFLCVSAILVYFFLNVKIVRVDLPFADKLLQLTAVSLLFTVFALAGISNAINIIDGFNGLASMVSMMILMSIAYVAYKLGDYEITTLCVVSTFALLGFFLLNYPYGLIFLGDGGAYFSGFIIGVASILIVYKHHQVSPWFALTVNIYPVYETFFSMYRRKILRKKPAMSPDALHMHTLFYKIFIKKVFNVDNPEFRNPLTSVFLWIINSFGVVPAIIFWNNTKALMLSSLAFTLFYTFLYWNILSLRKIRINSK